MNEDLLYRVAQVYYELERKTINQMVFVFPNHRAGMFFLKHLSSFIETPIFQPQVLAINELFTSLSQRQPIEQTDLLFRLYQIYNDITKGQTSFDNFLFWGKMMLSDFQEIDQHLVNAQELFGNIKDLKDIEEHFQLLISQGFATDNDYQSAQSFVQHISLPNDPNSEHYNKYKQHFLSIWETLLPCYEQLRENLRKDNLAYAGMLQREVVELFPTLQNQLAPRYVFVGFNALTQVERELMKLLQQIGKADFYWDYDAPALRDPNNQASFYYYHNNRTDFAPTPANGHLHARLQEMPPTRAAEGNTPQIKLIRLASRVGQAQEVARILNNIPDANLNVGVVLADEGMLQPLLKQLPTTISKVNVTMGYPLSLTPVYSLLLQMSELLTLHKETTNNEWLYYYKPVLSLLAHPYIQQHCKSEAADCKQLMLDGNHTYIHEKKLHTHPLLEHVFHHPTSNTDLLNNIEQLLYTLRIARETYDNQAEFLGQALRQVRNLAVLLDKYPDIHMEIKTLFSILLKLIESRPVPYEGEPLEGLQVMGVLESRSMVFKDLILTNCNDEIFPGAKSPNSFIPYDLRAYYKLPTPQLEDAIFAYNFYRLLSHSERVWMLMDTRTNNMSEGEVSRYIQQLKYQYNYTIQEFGIKYQEYDIKKHTNVAAHIQNTITQTPHSFSPSALNTYVRCPYKFYLTYIKHLSEPEQISETIEINQLGTVVHHVMQQLYEGQHHITRTVVETMKTTIDTTDIIPNAYKTEIYKHNPNAQLNGLDILMVTIAKQYVHRFLDYDLQIVPFEYLASEKEYSTTITVNANGTQQTIRLRGFIDRIDRVNGQLRIVDYKTGSMHNCMPKNDTSFFDPEAAKDSDHIRQTMLYCKTYLEDPQTTISKDTQNISPFIYYIKDGAVAILSSGTNYAALSAKFDTDLKDVIEEILNPEIPFKPNWNEQNCNDFCPFAEICKSAHT